MTRIVESGIMSARRIIQKSSYYTRGYPEVPEWKEKGVWAIRVSLGYIVD